VPVSVELVDPHGGEALQAWSFPDGSLIRVGRSRECDVRIDSDKVSRIHLEVECCEDAAWVLKSLGRNGCYVEGQQVNDHALADGTVVRLGRSGPQLRFREEDSEEIFNSHATLADPLQTFSELRLDARAVAEHSDELADQFGLDELRDKAGQLRRRRNS